MSRPEHSNAPAPRKLFAYAGPMLFFIVLQGLGDVLRRPHGALWIAAPEFWIYPLQTLVCASLLIYYRRDYEFHRLLRPILATAVALLVFVVWIAPQQFFHFPPRLAGFNPDIFAAAPALYWPTLAARFIRLVVVTPLVEEIFWRGFLLRYLISEKFTAVAFGAFSWLSFVIVTLAFGFFHLQADWPAALGAGALYNLVASRTKSLSSCVLAHCLTNLTLGLWIVATRQWGFW